MRRRLIAVTAVTTSMLVVAGAVMLISLVREEQAALPGPAPSSPSIRPAPAPTRSGPGPVPGLPEQLLDMDVEVIPTSQLVVALTFDAGANADAVPTILDTLSAERISAPFFLTGDFAAAHPGAVQAITAAGHRIGNHTATHPYPLTLSDTALRDQLTRAENQLRAVGAGDPRPLFRFPFGERDARTIAIVNDAGYLPVRWTVDSLGWQGLNGRTEPQAIRPLVDRVVSAARPGGIVLMHVGSHPDDHTTLDAAALPTVIDRLRADGYRFMTLDALLH